MFPNDNRAMIFLRAAKAVGLDVPGDVSVTGCDGIIPALDLIGLTTLRIPVEQVAERGVEVLERLMGYSGGTEVRLVYFSSGSWPSGWSSNRVAATCQAFGNADQKNRRDDRYNESHDVEFKYVPGAQQVGNHPADD
jgi:DNA-binding LacI/PurR family transcriptional regulator